MSHSCMCALSATVAALTCSLHGSAVRPVTYAVRSITACKRKHPTVKPDIDKLQRALYDAITETHIWHDDCQITDVISHKRYADDTPTGVFLTITWEPNQ